MVICINSYIQRQHYNLLSICLPRAANINTKSAESNLFLTSQIFCVCVALQKTQNYLSTPVKTGIQDFFFQLLASGECLKDVIQNGIAVPEENLNQNDNIQMSQFGSIKFFQNIGASSISVHLLLTHWIIFIISSELLQVSP